MKNTDTPFSLALELQRDCIELADWPLCKVLLMNDSQYPWFILVPRVAGVKEIIDLSEELQITLLQESGKLSKLLQQVFNPDKLNVAALGNMVPQLHVHHIARFSGMISITNSCPKRLQISCAISAPKPTTVPC